MYSHLQNIHIGSLIQQRIKELEIDPSRICNFMKANDAEIEQMLAKKDLSTDVLLQWSKLLEYDFFRLYSQQIILFAPMKKSEFQNQEQKKSQLPQFRKNIYTREIINFILKLIETEEKTKKQVIEEYCIPKTTLYKWISKYGKIKY